MNETLRYMEVNLRRQEENEICEMLLELIEECFTNRLNIYKKNFDKIK